MIGHERRDTSRMGLERALRCLPTTCIFFWLFGLIRPARSQSGGACDCIKNAWYVAGWASQIKSDELLSRTFLNVPIILYRDSDGNAVAMEDRCCHRFAPLSKGRLEGDSIRCMYHGLKFSATGDCIEIPGGDKIPPNMKVKTFPVTERQKLVWIWLGDPTLANETEITDLPYLSLIHI